MNLTKAKKAADLLQRKESLIKSMTKFEESNDKVVGIRMMDQTGYSLGDDVEDEEFVTQVVKWYIAKKALELTEINLELKTL